MSRKRGAKDVNDSIKTKRVKRVLELMGKGLYMFEIVDILMKEWDCSRRNVYKYIEKSKEILKNSISQSDKDEFINQFDQLLQKAYEIKDYKLANAILANKGRFTIGEKVEHSGDLSGIQIIINDGSKGSSNSNIQGELGESK